MRNKINYAVHNLHQKVFSTGIGDRTSIFLKGLSWSMSAALLARLISGITTILAARLLGPKEFGEANLSLAAILWIQIPLFWGMPMSIVHHISKAGEQEKQQWISEGVRTMTFLMLATAVAGYFLRHVWAGILGISNTYFLLALLWCLCFWFFTLLKSLLTASERFVLRSWVEVLYAALFPIVFCLFVERGFQSGAYILGLALPYGIVGICGLLYLRPSLAGFFKRGHHSKKLLLYGTLGTLGGVAAALFESPARLIANKTLSITEVGIISAYQGGSIQMAVFLTGIVSQVFFPIASRTPDKAALFKKLDRALRLTFPLQVLVFFAGLAVYVKVLGHNYPFDFLSCLIYSVAAALTMIAGILVWFGASHGWHGLTVTAGTGIVSGLLNVLMCHLLIPQFHVAGAAMATALSSAVWISLLYAPPAQRWMNQEKK